MGGAQAESRGLRARARQLPGCPVLKAFWGALGAGGQPEFL